MILGILTNYHKSTQVPFIQVLRNSYKLFAKYIFSLSFMMMIVTPEEWSGRGGDLLDPVVFFLGDDAVNTDDTPFGLHNHVFVLVLWVDNVEDLMD